jgi:uncharacterized protein YbjT (DUF2867 family)
MHTVTGITGKVGGSVARHLLNAGLSVRAVVRDTLKKAPPGVRKAAKSPSPTLRTRRR